MMMPWMSRAIWSAPPPVPAGTTSSTGLVGSHAACAGAATASIAVANAPAANFAKAVLVRESVVFIKLSPTLLLSCFRNRLIAGRTLQADASRPAPDTLTRFANIS